MCIYWVLMQDDPVLVDCLNAVLQFPSVSECSLLRFWANEEFCSTNTIALKEENLEPSNTPYLNSDLINVKSGTNVSSISNNPNTPSTGSSASTKYADGCTTLSPMSSQVISRKSEHSFPVYTPQSYTSANLLTLCPSANLARTCLSCFNSINSESSYLCQGTFSSVHRVMVFSDEECIFKCIFIFLTIC